MSNSLQGCVWTGGHKIWWCTISTRWPLRRWCGWCRHRSTGAPTEEVGDSPPQLCTPWWEPGTTQTEQEDTCQAKLDGGTWLATWTPAVGAKEESRWMKAQTCVLEDQIRAGPVPISKLMLLGIHCGFRILCECDHRAQAAQSHKVH